MERYLRLMNFNRNKIIYDMSYQICKFQLNDGQFLIYRPSEIAACSVIISINIYKRDQEKYDAEHNKNQNKSQSFFKNSLKNNE